jgi:tRNA G18 (ribose-2'-O)-methylase SpoU
MSNPQGIASLDDPRVAAYRNLKDRELAREGGRFIAEGEYVVRRLLASDFPTESVLLSERRVEEIAPLAPPDVPVYVASDEVMHQVIGFKFHSGVIACGRRKSNPSLEKVLDRFGPVTLMILPETANAENLGALVRIAAGFGANGLVLGERSCDPFWRQSIRVSMGTVFTLPIVRSEDLRRDLVRLREEFGLELMATVLDADAEPLGEVRRGERIGVLFGNEAQGLGRVWVEVCDRRITIPMKLGTDSLNVAVAAGVVMWELSRQTSLDRGQ